MKRKLKLVLALTQDATSRYIALIRDYSKFFSNQQGAFLGKKNTYLPKDDVIDDPSKREYVRVVTTIDEKLKYFVETTQEYIQNILTKERTNGMGIAMADLIVEGKNWGKFTSNELLALKSILDKSDLAAMVRSIPVRSETDTWTLTNLEEYQGRKIFEKNMVTQVVKTTVKESYILSDPNLDKLKSADSYKPQLSSKDTVMELGIQTRQEFSGQWSHVQRANALSRLTILRDAVTVALELANDVEVIESDTTSKQLFGYIFGL